MRLTVLLVVGCATPDRFAHRFTHLNCDRLARCDADVWVVFENQRDCVRRTRQDQERVTSCLLEHCAFDPSQAEACLDALPSCNDQDAYAPCSTVFHACDGDEGTCTDP